MNNLLGNEWCFAQSLLAYSSKTVKLAVCGKLRTFHSPSVERQVRLFPRTNFPKKMTCFGRKTLSQYELFIIAKFRHERKV